MNDYNQPTTPVEGCEHRVQHYHGNYVTYSIGHKCRCEDCRKANKRYVQLASRWHGEFPRETHPFVKPDRTRAHVQGLMDLGMGYKRVADLAGVPRSALGAIMWGRFDRPIDHVRRTTEARILVVELDYADGTRVPRGEADAIIEELQLRGWSNRQIARQIVGPKAESLQLHHDEIMAGSIRKLRLLLFQPVPMRYHGASKQWLDPATDHRAWPAFSTAGIPWTREERLRMDRRGLVQALGSAAQGLAERISALSYDPSGGTQ